MRKKKEKKKMRDKELKEKLKKTAKILNQIKEETPNTGREITTMAIANSLWNYLHALAYGRYGNMSPTMEDYEDVPHTKT